jgi:O-antigen/teichoic acid export membrane protein
MSQTIAASIILGMGRPQVVAKTTLTNSVLAVTLALLLGVPFGLVGVCLAYAIPATLCRGLFLATYACRTLGLSVWSYLSESLLPALLSTALPVAGLALVVGGRQPQTWAELIGLGTAYALVYFTCSGVLLLGFHKLRLHGGQILRGIFEVR